MQRPSGHALETRLAEVFMGALMPCDLGDGIEVVHDVEQIEIEMDCDLDEDVWYSAPYERIEILLEAAVARPACEDKRAASSGVLEPNAFERSPVWDTLPFTPYEPMERPHGLVR